MSAATKAPKAKLTLEDYLELKQLLDAHVDEHIDEIELNGGALETWLADFFEQVEGGMAAKADAIAAVVDAWKGKAEAAKSAKDRAARRQRVAERVVESVKARALFDLERYGVPRVEGAACVIRVQKNSAPSVRLTAPEDAHQDILLGQFDAEDMLSPFISVKRVATLDTRKLAAAYEAHAAELQATKPDADAVREALDLDFPGVAVTRGVHLRID